MLVKLDPVLQFLNCILKCISCLFIYLFEIFQWDEALLTMSSGEEVELTVEPEWAYGRKGNADGGYPYVLLNILITLLFCSIIHLSFVIPTL